MSSRMCALHRGVVAAFLFVSAFTPVANCQLDKPVTGGGPQTLLCKLPRIVGFDDEYNKAIKCLGHSTTTEPQNMKVFVSVKDSQLYVQSNYRREGESNPRKLSSNEKLPAGVSSALIQYIVSTRFEPSDDYAKLPIYLDQSTFDSPYFHVFDDSDNVSAIDSNGDAQKTTVVLKLNDGRRRVIIGDDDIYYDPKAFGNKRTFEHLRSRRFEGSSVSVLSLVNNTETTRALETNIPRDNNLNRKLGDLDEATVYSAFKENPDNTVIILGHIEEDSFITYSTDGTKVLMRIPIRALKNHAQAANVNLFLLGCNSVAVSESGVTGTFNTVDALTRLGVALKAATVGDFFSHLTPDGSHLVLRSDDLAGLGVDIHNKDGRQIGQIIFPATLWIASTQTTPLEYVIDIVSSIWHWFWGILRGIWSWITGHWVGILVFFVLIIFRLLKSD